jgi:Ase1/PRC1/MAP65 family protein
VQRLGQGREELWDALYFSEEEMLDFTPAFSDVCSDALLSAHEAEIQRLEALKEQRLPILQKIDRHRELVKERDDLQQSSQDASRLMGRGQKGERRDPGKLLREEKMRKRISKELPKIEAELRKTLERWEDEYGRPFLVLGDRYLDELYACEARAAPPPRSKTPNPGTMPSRGLSVSKSASTIGRASTVRGPPPSRSKTPVSNFGASISRNPNAFASSMSAASQKSPSKIPARAPLKTIPHGGNSPERRPTMHKRGESTSSTLRSMPPPMAPPPRMKDLFVPPEPASTPTNRFEFNRGERSGSIVRHVPPEDPYDDRSYLSQTIRADYTNPYAPPPASSSRQISNASSNETAGTMQSGSENWETFSEQSDEPERDADLHYYRQQAARNKRYTPEGGHAASPRAVHGKKIRSVRPVESGYMTQEGESMMRVVDGSEAGWTDDGDY